MTLSNHVCSGRGLVDYLMKLACTRMQPAPACYLQLHTTCSNCMQACLRTPPKLPKYVLYSYGVVWMLGVVPSYQYMVCRRYHRWCLVRLDYRGKSTHDTRQIRVWECGELYPFRSTVHLWPYLEVEHHRSSSGRMVQFSLSAGRSK